MSYEHARICKVGWTPKTSRLRLEWETPSGGEEWDEATISLKCTPHPDLLAALQALAPHVVEICEMEDLQEPAIEVRSVTYTWAHDVMGAVITALRHLQNSPAPLVLNTPHKPSDWYGDQEDGDPAQLLPEHTVRALRQLQKEAIEFLEGKRAPEPEQNDDREAA